MKLILFSGDHPRHLYINKEVLKFFEQILIIVMQREELLPKPPINLDQHDQKLFRMHFENRHKVESLIYGDLSAREIFKNYNSIFINSNELNSDFIANEVKNLMQISVLYLE